MLILSSAHDTAVTVRCATYRSLAGLSARLVLEGRHIEIPNLSTLSCLSVPAGRLSGLAPGRVSCTFEVYDADGQRIVRQSYAVEIVDGPIPRGVGNEIVCPIPVVTNLSGGTWEPSVPAVVHKNGVRYWVDIADDEKGVDLTLERCGD